MNTLNIIKKQIEKAAAQHDAQIAIPVIAALIAKFTKVVSLCTVPSAIAVVLREVIN